MNDVTDLWKLYQVGKDYNNKLNLNSTVDKNEAFYAGDQWRGVKANGLDTPVFNILKRITNFFIASIMSSDVAVSCTPYNVGSVPCNDEEKELIDTANLITGYFETLKESLKLNTNLRQIILDSAITGDGCIYSFFDNTIDTGQKAKGDINIELIDNVNVFFGNPNDRRVNYRGKPVQPYIIIAFRQLVSDLKKEAKANEIPQKEIDKIRSDTDLEGQAGDRGKIELDESGKCIALIKLWHEDGKIMAEKKTQYATIRDKWDTKLTIYPVAWMNWDIRKNSYHGQAVLTGLIPNQIFINKAFAMLMLWIRQMAIPKVLYNSTVIQSWSNQIGAAIGVEGSINDVAKYMTPSQVSNMVIKIIDMAIEYTKDMLGASDAALGDVKPENTSAIIAVQQAAAVPLELIKTNMYQFTEDLHYIYLDVMTNYYGKRKIVIQEKGERMSKEFDFSKLKNMKMNIKIDVGASSYWSEITAVQTLDNLLQQEKINFIQYLERLPSGLIPNKQQLLDDIKQEGNYKQFTYEMMTRYIEQLPQERYAELKQLPPEQMEKEVMEEMMSNS